MLLLTGKYDYSTDDKGRLSIPARHREQVERDGQPLLFYVAPGRDGQLNVYAEREYHEMTEELGAGTDEIAREALRFVSANTDTCPLDKQGRLVVSQALREVAGIKRDVVVVGMRRRIEIWDKERFAKYQEERGANIASAMKAIKGRADLM